MFLYILIFLLVLHSEFTFTQQLDVIKKETVHKVKCKNIKCPPIEDPVCVKIKNEKNNNIAFIVAMNKCEIQYAKCRQGFEAVIVPMKNCQHVLENGRKTAKIDVRQRLAVKIARNGSDENVGDIAEGEKEKDESIVVLNEDDELNMSHEKDETKTDLDSGNEKDGAEYNENDVQENNEGVDVDDKDVEGNDKDVDVDDKDVDVDDKDVDENDKDDDVDNKNVDVDDKDVDVDDKDVYGNDNEDVKEENEQYIEGENEKQEEVENENNEEIHEKQLNKSFFLDYDKSIDIKTSEEIEEKEDEDEDEDEENKSKDISNVAADYDQITEDVDYNENENDCPSVCAAREVMVCAKCQHNIYRTFMSPCHLRLFNCKYPDESLELVSRQPCIQSAPFLTDLPIAKGRISEPGDQDRVLKFIQCRDKGRLGNDPRCNFDNRKFLNK